MKRACLLVSAVALILSTMSPATHAGGGPNFSRFVGVGDSLTAGFKDGALFADGQSTGFYTRLATSMGTQVVIPSIAFPGIPTPNAALGQGLLLQIPGTCQVGATTFATGQTTGRVDPTMPATDVAIPGQSMGEALTTKWSIDLSNLSTVDSAEDFVLGFPYAFAPPPANTPRTQIETAIGLQPTFLSIWLGSNDALGAALAATVDDTTLTPVADFRTNADTAFAALAATGAEAVVFNVPDVTVIPNLFSVSELSALTGLDAAQIKLLFGVQKDSFVPLSALPTIQAIAMGQQQGPLAPNQILTRKEVKKIRKNVKQYNIKLKALADANGWAFVDVNAILTDIARNGLVVTGVGTITTAYLGGLFGLDGVHPSATGHAVIASAAIDSINAKYGTTLAKPNVASIAAADPQVCMAKSAQTATLADLVKYAPAARSAESVILNR